MYNDLMQNAFSMTYEDLVESETIGEFYRILWDLHGIPVTLVNHELKKLVMFFPKGKTHPICQIIRSTEKGLSKCLETDTAACNKAMTTQKGIRYACHAGLVDFAVPINIDGKLLAVMIGGQIISEKPTQKGFRELCDHLKDLVIDKKALRKAYFDSSFMTPKQIESLMALINFFVNYFCQMGRLLKSARQSTKFLEISQAKEYMEKNFREPLTMPEVAEYACLSEAYFSRLFKKVIGYTFTQYLQSLRLDEVKNALSKTNLPISKIAFDCGFYNLSYFNELFKKSEKCSPTNYRKTKLLSKKNK